MDYGRPKMSLTRRAWVKLGGRFIGLLSTYALPLTTLAAYNKAAFDTKVVLEAVKSMGASSFSESKDISFNAPDYAENGATVALGVNTSLAGVKKILILVEKNPAALVASFQVSDSIEPNFSTRIKMSQTSDVYAVAILSDGKALFSKKEVKVTIGGCGN
jgi:sulfur-oxidizing protein SoxY